MIHRSLKAIYRRLPPSLQHRARSAYEGALGVCASVWRRCVSRALIIGITGSVGKTTATEMLGWILAAESSTVQSVGGSNSTTGVPRTVLRIRRSHRFAVVEAGTWSKGDLRWMSKVIRPRIAAILSVSLEHYTSFRTLEAVTLEKQSFLDGVQSGGIAWLNGDDPNVAAMYVPGGIRVRRFGSSPDFNLWADNLEGAWPDRMSFDVHSDGQTQSITTQLVGTHWLPSALAAIGIALDCGLTLDRIAIAVADFEPVRARLQPVPVSTGAILLRDENKASPTSLQAAFQVLGEARGVRRWVVFGGMDDTPLPPRQRMSRTGRQVPQVAEAAIFLGDHAETAVKRAVAAGMSADLVFHAPGLESAARILREHTRAGDLILLKGVHSAHLTRIYYALEEERFGPVTCWKPHCDLRGHCDGCPQLHGSLKGLDPRTTLVRRR